MPKDFPCPIRIARNKYEKKFNKPWKDSMGAIIQEAYRCLVMDKSYSYVIV